MAILDDFTIDYANKRIEHTSGTTVYAVNDLYSALQDTFDELGQMDDDVPMSAQTPTEYTLINGWFMGDTDMQYLDSGAIQTSGWTGSVIIKRDWVTGGAGGDIDTADIGGTITGDTSTETGTIMDVNSTEVWIRLDNVANDFNNGEGFTVSGTSTHTGSFGAIAAETGENLWANPFSLGTIASDTELYVVQNSVPLTVYWPEGHIDILVKVKDMDVEIDEAVIEVFAHKPGTLYDHFQIDLTSGGRQPIPLATSGDLNDASGHHYIEVASASADFAVDEVVTGSPSGAKALVTSNTGNPTTAFEYFVIGDGTTNLDDADELTGSITGANGSPVNSSGSPINASDYSDVTFTFNYVSGYDLGGGAGAGNYGITVDCGSRTSLLQVYERIKYITRHGETTATLNGTQGEEYIGLTVALTYNSGSAHAVGDIITGDTTGATGIVAAATGTTSGTLYLHNVKGTFNNTETLSSDGSGTGTSTGTTSITLNKQGAFASYAGGTLFGAQGVRFINIPTGENNNYQLTDLAGTVHTEPSKVDVEVTSVVSGDTVFVAKRDGSNNVVRTQYTGSPARSVGSADITVAAAETVDTDTPNEGGAEGSGTIRVARTDGTDERYRYASYSGNTFTLSTVAVGDGVDTGSPTGFTDSAADFISSGSPPYVGDRIRNTTTGNNAVITSIVGSPQITTTTITGGWNASDTYEINKVNVTINLADALYVPYVDRIADDTEEKNIIIYDQVRNVTVRVRKKGIIPFVQNTAQITSTGMSVSAIRTTDTIVTL